MATARSFAWHFMQAPARTLYILQAVDGLLHRYVHDLEKAAKAALDTRALSAAAAASGQTGLLGAAGPGVSMCSAHDMLGACMCSYGEDSWQQPSMHVILGVRQPG